MTLQVYVIVEIFRLWHDKLCLVGSELYIQNLKTFNFGITKFVMLG